VVIVDTSVWVDFFRGDRTAETEWLYRARATGQVALIDVILCEVLQGHADDGSFQRVRAGLTWFDVFATGGATFAIAAARNYRMLRARGRTVRGTIDTWIATFCLMHGHQLLHSDRDFDHCEEVLGLRVIHP
jgi:predicted nucleic acid-binding protein